MQCQGLAHLCVEVLQLPKSTGYSPVTGITQEEETQSCKKFKFVYLGLKN